MYWENQGNSIGRANLDGTGVNQNFITGLTGVGDIAVDGTHIYWANLSTFSIGRANLDGSGVNQSFISTGGQPSYIAVAPVPEPSTALLLSAGIAGLAVRRRGERGASVG